MARNIVWPFACFSTQRIELPHKDQIHGSGLLACRARMLSFVLFLSLFFFFFLSYVFLYLKKKMRWGKKPFWNSPLSYWELYCYKLKSYLTK